jgi:hypothetical protein
MRFAEAARALVGATELLKPDWMVDLAGADPDSGRVRAVARVLGGRHLLQASVVAARPSETVRWGGVVVDLLHAASMVLLALVSRKYRRPACTSAAMAVALAAVSRPEPRPPRPRPLPTVVVHHKPKAEPPTPADRERAAHHRAEVVTRREDDLVHASAASPTPWPAIGATLLLAAGIWLIIAQWSLNYPFTSNGQDAAVRDVGFGVVLAFCALRLLLAKRSVPASVIALLSGVLLVVVGLWLDDATQRTSLNEVICGVVALLAGGLTVIPRRPEGRV